MKIVIWLLSICVFFLALGIAAILHLHREVEPAEDAESDVPQATVNAADKGERNSPVLGKDIPGLPEYCANKLISITDCDGMTEVTTDQGNTYRLVEIGRQCWFVDLLQENPEFAGIWNGHHTDNPFVETLDFPKWSAPRVYTGDYIFESPYTLCPHPFRMPDECDFFNALLSEEGRNLMYYPTGERLEGSFFLGHVGYTWVYSETPRRLFYFPSNPQNRHGKFNIQKADLNSTASVRCIK